MKSYKSHFRSMIFIYFKGLMTKSAFLIKNSIFTGSCCAHLKEHVHYSYLRKDFQCFTILYQYTFESFCHIFIHTSASLICVYSWHYLSYLKTNLSRAGFSFQHKILFISFLIYLIGQVVHHCPHKLSTVPFAL